MRFTNEHPTPTEKVMFEYNGLYLVEKTDTSYRYATIHLENEYSYTPTLNVENDAIEWENTVFFDTCSKTVTLHGDFDSIGIQLILKRMKELNWNILE